MARDRALWVGLSSRRIKINEPHPCGEHVEWAEDEKGGLVDNVHPMIAAECSRYSLPMHLIMPFDFFALTLGGRLVSRDEHACALALGVSGGLPSIHGDSAHECVRKQAKSACRFMLRLVFDDILDAVSRRPPAGTRLGEALA